MTTTGQSGSARWVTDVDDDDVAHFVPRQQVTTTESAEGDGEIGPRHAVHDSGQQVDPGGTINGNDGNVEIENPCEQRGHVRHAVPRRAGAEQRVDREPDGRPGSIGTRPRGLPRPGPSLAIRSRSSDPGPADATQTGTSTRCSARATTQPSPPLLPGPAGHQHTGPKQMRVAIGQDHRDRPRPHSP